MPKFLAPIDLTKNEIQNAVFQNLTTAPSSPVKGQFYFNSSSNTLYVYDGTAWKDALSQGVINYNNLTNIPIINAGSSTVSTPGIYRTTTATTTFSGVYKAVEHQGALVIYDGTHAIEIYGTDIKYHGPTASSEVIDIISSINSLGSNKVTKNPAITGATKTKITYDSKGLVTAGADLAASDIPDLSSTYIPQTAKGAASGVAPLNSSSKIDSTYIPDLSSTYLLANKKGAANGVAELDSNGLVPESQLPSYVDDVIDLLALTNTAPSTCAKGDKYFNTTSNKIFTATATNTWGSTGKTPETGVIYVNLADNSTYRWSGSAMVKISNPLDIATLSEAQAGTNDTKVMTPLKVKQALAWQYVGLLQNYSYKETIGNGTSTRVTLHHNFSTHNVMVAVYENNEPYQQVYPDIYMPSPREVTLEFSTAPTTNQYKVYITALPEPS